MTWTWKFRYKLEFGDSVFVLIQSSSERERKGEWKRHTERGKNCNSVRLRKKSRSNSLNCRCKIIKKKSLPKLINLDEREKTARRQQRRERNNAKSTLAAQKRFKFYSKNVFHSIFVLLFSLLLFRCVSEWFCLSYEEMNIFLRWRRSQKSQYSVWYILFTLSNRY